MAAGQLLRSYYTTTGPPAAAGYNTLYCSHETLPMLPTSLSNYIPAFSTLHMQGVDVSVEAKLIFIEQGRRWAHSSSSSRAPGIPYQGTMKTSVGMLRTSGGL